MKKYIEIIEEIAKNNELIKQLEAEYDKTEAEYNKLYEGLTLKQKVEKRKENKAEFDAYLETIKDISSRQEKAKICGKYLQNNAKLALFNEVAPKILKILAKYNGKPFGEKTKQKIWEEIKTETNCSFYFSDRYGDMQEIHIKDWERNYEVIFGTKFNQETKTRKPFLVSNKIQAVNFEDLEVYYINMDFYENVEETVEKLLKLREEAKAKLEELKAIQAEYNDLTVDGLNNLRVNEDGYSWIM